MVSPATRPAAAAGDAGWTVETTAPVTVEPVDPLPLPTPSKRGRPMSIIRLARPAFICQARRVHLDQAGEGVGVGPAGIAGGDRLVDRLDRAGHDGGRAAGAARIADGDHRVTRRDRRGVSDRDGFEA